MKHFSLLGGVEHCFADSFNQQSLKAAQSIIGGTEIPAGSQTNGRDRLWPLGRLAAVYIPITIEKPAEPILPATLLVKPPRALCSRFFHAPVALDSGIRACGFLRAIPFG